MDNLFKILFCSNVNLTQLTILLNQNEDTVIKLLNKTKKMTKEQKVIIEELIGLKLKI